ncbi:hypothetical protein K438DRAFT_2013015 [Mycena galopus ATCC 62051]|nr:hypothetical protein K438DRAFT_2013015 [Mycena galopus ATCC 62051]
MPGKRKLQKVPQALHSELSEYSSLLRALSTNDAFDVARRLTEPRPSKKRKKRTQEESAEEDTGNADEGASRPVAPPPKKQRKPTAESAGEEDTVNADEGTSRKRTAENPLDAAEGEGIHEVAAESSQPPEEEPQGRTRKRDTWTRWPLLVTDLSVPEWGLEDEIEPLMRQCLRNNPHPTAEDDASSGEEFGSEDAPSWLPHLTQSSSAFLSSMFALLAHHTPPRPQSMQDRLNPIDWKMVLDILSACGSVDKSVINNVKTRMEAIYGLDDSPGWSNSLPSNCGAEGKTYPAISRLETRAAIKARTSAALDEAYDALFLVARPTKRPPKHILEEVDSDGLDD